MTVPSAPITIGIFATFVCHSFFRSLTKSTYLSLSLFSLSFSVTLWSAGTAKSTIQQVVFFFLLFFFYGWLSLGLVISSYFKIPEKFSRTDSGLYISHMFAWSNLNYLHSSQWISFPSKSCLLLYIFCANLRHSLVIRSDSVSLLRFLFLCLVQVFSWEISFVCHLKCP